MTGGVPTCKISKPCARPHVHTLTQTNSFLTPALTLVLTLVFTPLIGGIAQQPEAMSDRGRQFTFEPESNIGRGAAAISTSAATRSNGNKAGNKAGSFPERIARGRALLQQYADERLSVLLAPHLTAFAEDAIDQAELAWHKAEAREKAEDELSARRHALEECEMLLDMGIEADTHVNALSQELEQATSAR